MSTVKTESIALNALEAIIDDEPSMEYQFNSNDREMSWDGFISLTRCQQLRPRRYQNNSENEPFSLPELFLLVEVIKKFETILHEL